VCMRRDTLSTWSNLVARGSGLRRLLSELTGDRWTIAWVCGGPPRGTSVDASSRSWSLPGPLQRAELGPLLQHCYSATTAPLQHRYSTATAPLQHRYSSARAGRESRDQRRPETRAAARPPRPAGAAGAQGAESAPRAGRAAAARPPRMYCVYTHDTGVYGLHTPLRMWYSTA
jgi:hypothetical protein